MLAEHFKLEIRDERRVEVEREEVAIFTRVAWERKGDDGGSVWYMVRVDVSPATPLNSG